MEAGIDIFSMEAGIDIYFTSNDKKLPKVFKGYVQNLISRILDKVDNMEERFSKEYPPK